MNTARTGFLDEQHAEWSEFEAMRLFATLLIHAQSDPGAA